MSCPVCNRTLQNVGADNKRIFWCPCCGTLMDQQIDDQGNITFQSHEVPRWTRLLRRTVRGEMYLMEDLCEEVHEADSRGGVSHDE